MAFIDYDQRGNVIRVRCKGDCNTILVDGKNQPTPDYCEVVLGMREPDGLLSKHETAVCRGCRTRLIADGPRPGELEALFAEDVEQWIDTAIRGGLKAMQAYKLGERQALRQPLRVLDEPSRAEAH